MPAIGIVSTHAQTMRPATPHLTAEKRFAEPTPTIEPVIVCVVETGNAESGRTEERDRAGGLGAKALHGLELDDLGAHRLDDPPAAGQRSKCDRCAAASSTQRGISGNLPSGVMLQKPPDDQHDGDYAHRLLSVVAAVPE